MFTKKKLLLQLEFENRFIYQIMSDEIDHTLLIGRDRLCDWRIPATDKSASNRHAELFMRRGKVYIRDLNSHNGVFYLGEKITERVLSPGERYGIGDTILVVSQFQEDKADKTKNKYHRLEQLNGKNRKKIYELSANEYIIGSAYDANIQFDGNMVSQHHARLEVKPDGSCWITDLGSRNGTYVNRMKLSVENTDGRMLQHGDILSIVNIDLCFYDKDVAVQKSYLLLKSLCAVLTIAILLALYFFWQSLLPSSKAYIETARKYAELRQFDEALVLLDKAADAPKAAVYQAEYVDLKNQIENWKTTVEKWEEAKALIVKRKWVSGNKLVAGLVVAKNDIWNWNDSDAVESRREAYLTAEILEPFLRARILLAAPDTAIEALIAERIKLNRALSHISGQDAEHFLLLHQEGKIIAEELDYVIANLETVENAISRANVDTPMDSEVAIIQKIYDDARKRSQLREKINRRLTAKLVQERCKLYLAPLKELAVCQKEFNHNMAVLSSLEFKRFQKNLSLPSAELCAASPHFTNLRAKFQERNEILFERGKQLEFLVNSLKTSGIAVSEQPDMLKKWHDKTLLPKLVECDCFQYHIKSWSPYRKEPIGEYDRFLGIEFFWEFLRDLPEKFDAALLDDRKFLPEIIQIQRVYADMEDFNAYMEDPIIAAILTTDVTEPNLMKLALWIDELLSARDKMVMEYIARSKTTQNKREALIAGGIALLLDNGNNNVFEGEYERIANVRKQSCRETDQIANSDATPEQIILNRSKIIAIGLPGDPAVRQAFSDMCDTKNGEMK